MILTPLQKLDINVSDLGKIIAATSFECLPKKQKIAQSGHTVRDQIWRNLSPHVHRPFFVPIISPLFIHQSFQPNSASNWFSKISPKYFSRVPEIYKTMESNY